jgi:hypothetical protein
MYQGGMYVIIGSPFGPLEGNTQQVEITLSKCLRVWQQVFERWTHCCLADIWRNITFNVIFTITNNIIESVKKIVLQWLVVYLCKMILCMYCFYTMYMCDLWTSFFSRGDQLDCIALLTYLFPNIYIRNLDIHYFSCRFVFFYCFFYFFYFYFFLCFEDWKKLYICFTLIVIDPLIYYHWLFVVFVISDHRLEEG